MYTCPTLLHYGTTLIPPVFTTLHPFAYFIVSTRTCWLNTLVRYVFAGILCPPLYLFLPFSYTPSNQYEWNSSHLQVTFIYYLHIDKSLRGTISTRRLHDKCIDEVSRGTRMGVRAQLGSEQEEEEVRGHRCAQSLLSSSNDKTLNAMTSLLERLERGVLPYT